MSPGRINDLQEGSRVRINVQAIILAVVGCIGIVAVGCNATTQRLQLAERSAVSNPDEFAARRGIRLLPDELAILSYQLPSESFELYVPAPREFSGEAIGLVWVSAGKSGAPPANWASVLDRYDVHWIGANAAGNQRSPPDRINLALDAAQHLRGLLGHTRARVFVGGFSGGARIASEAALLYPDIFSGALLAGAADYFRFVESSDPRWAAWAPTFPPAAAKLLRLAKARGRYVFVTGTDDSNRTLVQDVSRAYLADGFSFARLIDIPQLGHKMPTPACFERALVELLAVGSTEWAEPRRPIEACR